MRSLCKFAILAILAGCQGVETVTKSHGLEESSCDPWKIPHAKKLFEIKIK